MKEDENILESTIEAMKNDQIPPGPSQELVNATVTKLSEDQELSDTMTSGRVTGFFGRIRSIKGIARYAAAAVLLIVAGYAVGRFSAPRPPDIEELQTTLEPAIRRNVIAQLSNDMSVGLASMESGLEQQRRQDMELLAEQILVAYNTVTNERLTNLIESIDAAQTEDRQWVTAALKQIEIDRLRDNAKLGTAFVTFAERTQDEIEQTKLNFTQLLSDGLPEGSDTYGIEHSDKPDERTNK